jgi:hypothetical protein
MEDSMSKHTPGPWGDVHGIIQATNNYIIARIDAPVHLHNEITEANARLIAAAPDMLAALKEIIVGAKRGFPGCTAALEAIAKAEGTS